MKKTLLAAALLAGFAAGAAQAETSVTLYGLIDMGLGYNKIKFKDDDGSKHSVSRVGMLSGGQSGSRWGLRGSEDLGDGLRVIFNVESGFNATNGRSAQGNRLFGRQATLGLTSDSWGTLEFGRQTNIASKYVGAVDPFNNGLGQSNIGHGISAANTVWYDNLMLYRTPDFNGFQFGVGYSFNVNNSTISTARTTAPNIGRVETNSTEQFRTTNNVRALTAGLRYLNGPLYVSLAYDQLRNAHNVSNKAKPKSYSIGASYDFEVVKLSAAYARTTDGWFNAQVPGSGQTVTATDGDDIDGYGTLAFADKFRANSYMLGVSAPIGGSGTLFASGQLINPKNKRLTGDDKTTKVFSAGYTYDFSKRTNLYVYASHAKNYAFFRSVNSTSGGVGLRHKF